MKKKTMTYNKYEDKSTLTCTNKIKSSIKGELKIHPKHLVSLVFESLFGIHIGVLSCIMT